MYVHKAKILKAPKFDMSKWLELHGESTDVSQSEILSLSLLSHAFALQETGTRVVKDFKEPEILESV